MDGLKFPIDLYFKSPPKSIENANVLESDDDFREVFIADDGTRKIVIKHLSNTFSAKERIIAWGRLMEAYCDLGIYCPKLVENISGEIVHCYIKNGKKHYVYAEEFAIYKTAEQIRNVAGFKSDILKSDAFRSLGKVAKARLDILDFPSAYCLLEPFVPTDAADETTECARNFTGAIKEYFPKYTERAEKLLQLFFVNQEELKKVYHLLPASCFQADLGDTNVLADEYGNFKEFIDFNLCGREPVLNYAVRAAMRFSHTKSMYGDNEETLFLYDKQKDDKRITKFLQNLSCIKEEYVFNETEKSIFPVLLRYMNSYWWDVAEEIKKNKGNDEKAAAILDWLEYQMTRDDIRIE